MAAFEGIGAVHNVVNLAADSKLRERSKEKFAEGMAKATEGKPLANMRIPVDRWDEYWQQQKQDPAEVAAGLGVSQGYGEAKLGAGGDDLVIPTSDFTAKMDPKHFTGLLPDMRGYDQFGRPTQTGVNWRKSRRPRARHGSRKPGKTSDLGCSRVTRRPSRHRNGPRSKSEYASR